MASMPFHGLDMQQVMTSTVCLRHVPSPRTFPVRCRVRSRTVSQQCCHCGRRGHLPRDSSCPANGITCHKYHKIGHFAAHCRSRHPAQPSKRPLPRREPYHVADDNDQHDDGEGDTLTPSPPPSPMELSASIFSLVRRMSEPSSILGHPGTSWEGIS